MKVFEPRMPYRGSDWQYVRDADGGARWQSRDGMVVRVAAPEPGAKGSVEAAVPERENFVWMRRVPAKA